MRRITIVTLAFAIFNLAGTPRAHALTEVGSDDQRLTFNGPAWEPAITYNTVDDRFLVCTGAYDGGPGSEISCSVLTPELGVLAGDVEISYFGTQTSDAQAFSPAVAHNSTDNEYLACWHGDSNDAGHADSEFEVYCRLLTANLGFIGPTFQVSDQGGSGDPDEDAVFPSVAYNFKDNSYLACWSGDQKIPFLAADDEYEVFCRSIAADGTLGSITQFSAAGGLDDPAYDAFNPTVTYTSTILTNDRFTVCWEADDDEGGLVDGESEIFCRLADGATGAPVGDQTRMTHQGADGDASTPARRPTVAYDPFRSRLLICWDGALDDASHSVGEHEVFCGEWNRSLAPTLSAVQASDAGPAGDPAYNAWFASTAWTGDAWLSCWIEDELSNDAWEVACRQLGLDLSPLGLPTTVSSMGEDQGAGIWDATDPAVVRAGQRSEALVVWSGDDDGAGLSDGHPEVFGQRLGTDADLVFADGFESGDIAAWSSTVP